MQRKLFKSALCSLAAGMLLMAGSSPASAAPIKWFDGFGANGHFYEIVGNGLSDGNGTRAGANLTWAAADAAALAAPAIAGHRSSLVTITSQREFNFLTNTVDGGVNHGVIGAAMQNLAGSGNTWIGLRDPAGGADEHEWVQVTLGSSTLVQEPVSFTNWGASQPSNGADDVVRMQASGFTWFDQASTFVGNAYIIEWSPIPEPGSMVLCGLGALAMAGYGWRRRRNKNKATA